jgi:LCP family protein required for cell wall assembly
MPREDKPYRVYRGGRVKGRVPRLEPPGRAERRDRRPVARPAPEAPRRPFPWRRAIVLTLLVLVLAVVAWALLSYLAVRSGVKEANARLDPAARAALDPQEGLLLNRSTTIALFGTDHAENVADRQTARRADSILLIRTDPGRNRLAYLSIPRDLRVTIPGRGSGKINSAYQIGGPALALRTVRTFTGIPINHVAIVDFGSFAGVIDALGGITVDVPRPIVSNRFDCPYATPQQCRRWEGWRFAKGEQELDGRRALIYSRIRENRLDAGETDITRGGRQQEVLDAITSEATSPATALRMPTLGDDLLQPLATDLSAWEFVQLGWRKFRSDDARTLHCRLGGEASSFGGEAVLIPSEENRNVIAMFTGASAPQPPPPGSGPFGPGCVTGTAR